ncbi:50S ribosomal protein L25/general stress protein Ctc [Luteimicrobium subarcticum]|uniref:Large ribosomal subunit protein bL25 n=1 Tax=Luteimicrobium subarcticum TaxID=620910 RepID=A0A2M8WT70_9MICO|nr:50S ribosomal protein L25/general stress protein Ctc [Luteimicrobium subarcticum]PJI94094.1 large subunit ribosomal protein L25 [Luteimicrobium subarcticum]
MSETKLTAETRTEFGKGAARRLRRAHQIPAVVYGHGSAPLHVALPGHETMLALKHHSNALLELDVDGKDILAIAKDVQVEPVRNVIEHIDLIIVKKGEKIVVDVPVVVEGEAAPGTTTLQDANTLSVEAEATHLPESLSVSVEGLEAGAKVTAGELELPKGVTLLSDAETLVVAVNEAFVEPAEDEAADAAEAAPAAEETEEA